ncbi:UNVERIFIED_CONTAM: hypothetical protein Scaly_2851900 [Sesamum calycinum]|uniref:Integrase catalytic domain-containing protein n=1 Tax=Sesamum calycinum TaxID=2727403 RepID=A0AAW2LGS4_9LAMI
MGNDNVAPADGGDVITPANGGDSQIWEMATQSPMVWATTSLSPMWEWARERRGWVLSNSRGQTISAPIAVRKGIRRGIVPIYLPIKVCATKKQKASKCEVVLRFGDGKAVAAEAVGIINLVIDYLKKNGIVSQWTPPETPQLNGVAEMRNRTLLDMIRSMMSFTELLLSFWGYALETAARLLNIASSKTVAQTPYQIWHGKPASYKFIGYPKETAGYYFYNPSEQKVFVLRNAVFLERGFPTDPRRDELLLEESSEALQSNAGTSSTPTVSTDNVPILRRSARVPQAPERYGFLGVTDQLVNDPKTYGEAISDIDSGKWLEAMKSEMDSISSNQVWTLVDRPKGVRPVGSIAKSIRIMLAIAVWDKAWLSTQFSMKDLGEASYILRIKIFRISKRILRMTQNSYVEKVLKRFKMEHSKQGFLPMRHGVKLSKKQSLKIDENLKGCWTSSIHQP